MKDDIETIAPVRPQPDGPTFRELSDLDAGLIIGLLILLIYIGFIPAIEEGGSDSE